MGMADYCTISSRLFHFTETKISFDELMSLESDLPLYTYCKRKKKERKEIKGKKVGKGDPMYI